MSILLFYYALLGVFAITSAVAAPTGSPPPTQDRAPITLPLRQCNRPTGNPTPGASGPQANVPEDAWNLLSHNGGTLGKEDWYRIISPDAPDTPGFKWSQMDDVINFEVIEGITNVAFLQLQRSVGSSIGMENWRYLVTDPHVKGIVERSSLTPVNEISGIKIHRCPLGGYWTTVSNFTTV